MSLDTQATPPYYNYPVRSQTLSLFFLETFYHFCLALGDESD